MTIDPDGRWGAVLIAGTVAGTAAAIYIYFYRDCIKKCDTLCPIKQGGDEQQESDRRQWVLKCKATCTKPWVELGKLGPW